MSSQYDLINIIELDDKINSSINYKMCDFNK